jgi:hypothetical protein
LTLLPGCQIGLFSERGNANNKRVKNNLNKIILKAQGKVYFVFGAISGLPLLFLLWVLYKTQSHGTLDAGLLKIIVAWIFASAIIFLWLMFFRIEMSDEGISYRTIWKLGRAASLTFSEIDKAEIKIGVFKYTDRFKPTVRLELKPKPGVKKLPLIINLKVFPANDLKKVFTILDSKGIRMQE